MAERLVSRSAVLTDGCSAGQMAKLMADRSGLHSAGMTALSKVERSVSLLVGLTALL
jgi:cyclopropane fatty-acyl-phospholipid synthase-like methyltransferase